MMLRKWVVPILIMLPLVFAQSGWALEMEAEEGSSRLHIHGYGELHYNMPQSPKGPSKMDFHRMVWGLSYEISDSISLHTEVDFEHAANEMELEFAYLDFQINPAFNVRAGAMLMPVGPLNEFHEPPLFYSVERPAIQTFIIPTTWGEGGAGIFGSPLPGLRYRVYVVAGLAASGFSAEKGIRGGRGKVSGGSGNVKDKPPKTGEELAVVGRLEYSPIPGLDLGVSLYEGGVDQANNIGGDPSLGIVEVDGRVRMAGVDFQAVYVHIDIDDADQINAKFSKNVAKEMSGLYVELAYRLGTAMGTDWDLVPFIRFEEINTQDKMPAGTNPILKWDRKVYTYGLAFFPHPQVALKADFEDWENDDPADPDWEQVNLGVAYMF